jgi:hypothetical protein
MGDFGSAALLGLGIGFLWGTGCSLAILYSIYMGGYRKAIQDSLSEPKPRRFRAALEKILSRRDKPATSAK